MSGHDANKAGTIRKSYLLSSQERLIILVALAHYIDRVNITGEEEDLAISAQARLT